MELSPNHVYPMAEKSVRKSSSSSQRIAVVLAILVILAVGITLASQFSGTSILPKQISDRLTITPPAEVTSGSPTPSPTPVTIRTGKVVANMSQSKETLGPKLRRVEIDNNDPKVGEEQTLKARIVHTSPVVTAEVILTTDSRTFSYPLKLESGTNLDGVYVSTWTLEDTVLYRYMFTFVLKGQDGNESKLDYPKR